jgi:transposase-like protein
MTPVSSPVAPAKRRHYSPEFKDRIVEACRQPGVSVARTALDNGLNANLVRRWIRDAQERTVAVPAFLPVPMPRQPPAAPSSPSTAEAAIRIEIAQPGRTVVVSWPVAHADPCLSLLRDLLR